MNKKTAYTPWDAADYLDSEEMIAEFLSVCAADPNPDLFVAALRDVARARGMTQLAKDSGLGRESLYKALRPGSHPRHETITAILRALNIKVTFAPVV